MMEGRPGADSEEKREPVSDIDTAVADSLKVLDLKRPIREADIAEGPSWATNEHLALENRRVSATTKRACVGFFSCARQATQMTNRRFVPANLSWAHSVIFTNPC